jgi:hypothetical protein
LIEGGQVDVSAEGVEEDIGVVGVDCQKYEEPRPCGSAGVFLLGEQTEGDTSGREEVEACSLSLEINDSNVCHFLLPSIASPTAGNNHHQADDINASPPAGNHHASPPACNHQDFEATTAPVDGDQVEEELSIALPKPSKPIPSRPKTSNKFGRGKRRGGDRKTHSQSIRFYLHLKLQTWVVLLAIVLQQ